MWAPAHQTVPAPSQAVATAPVTAYLILASPDGGATSNLRGATLLSPVYVLTSNLEQQQRLGNPLQTITVAFSVQLIVRVP